MTTTATWNKLLKAAVATREHAVPNFSGVKVGAALRTDDGTVITGCNVESPSIIFHSCAERTALLTALARGYRTFTHCAVIADFTVPIAPCGYCRQALLEFAPDAEVLMANLDGDTCLTTVRALLPLAYDINDRAVTPRKKVSRR